MLLTRRLLVGGVLGKVGDAKVSLAEFWMVLFSQRLEIGQKIVPRLSVSLMRSMTKGNPRSIGTKADCPKRR